MTRPLDPYEKDASRREAEVGANDHSLALAVAEERRDPRESPDRGDWLELGDERFLVLGYSERGDVMVERMHCKRGQHRLLTPSVRAFQERFLGAVVLGKRTTWASRRAISLAARARRDAMQPLTK